MNNQSLRTTIFSESVVNPILAVYTLGSDGGSGYFVPCGQPGQENVILSANTEYTVYCDEVIPHPCASAGSSYHLSYIDNFSFSGREGYGMVQFVGTFTSITLNYSLNHQYSQIVWGLPCTANTFNP